MNIKFLAPLALCLTLTGCISPTTYHPYNGSDGYQDVQMNRRLIEVRYTGNVATPQSNVHNMMLYRAAEMAKNQGFRYFKVLSQDTQRHREVFVEPGSSSTYVEKRHHEKRRYTTYTPPTRTVENSYTTILRARLMNHSGGIRVYNANLLMQSLGPQMAWPKKKQ